jgi:predicted RNA-binding protein with RPS1 domain
LKPSVKQGKKQVEIKEVIKISNQINDVIDVGSYLSDQVWDRDNENHSTLVISNPTNETMNTEDILLNMYDTDKRNIDFQTKISSIDVPANSSVIVEMLFKNIDTSGMKRIYGVYDNETYSSGNILVDNNINNGLSIEELYRRKNRRYDGGMDESLYLNPNIIL